MYSSFSKKFRQIKPYDNYNVTDVPWHEAMVAGNGRLGVLESCAPIEDSIIYQNVEFVMPSEEPRHRRAQNAAGSHPVSQNASTNSASTPSARAQRLPRARVMARPRFPRRRRCA